MYRITCLYCNHSWDQYLNPMQAKLGQICFVCKDEHAVAKPISLAVIDTYEGCPPFPEKPVAESKEEPKEVEEEPKKYITLEDSLWHLYRDSSY